MDPLGGVHWPQRPSGLFFLGAREARDSKRQREGVELSHLASLHRGRIVTLFVPAAALALTTHVSHPSAHTLPTDAAPLWSMRGYPPSLLPALPPALTGRHLIMSAVHVCGECE